MRGIEKAAGPIATSEQAQGLLRKTSSIAKKQFVRASWRDQNHEGFDHMWKADYETPSGKKELQTKRTEPEHQSCKVRHEKKRTKHHGGG